MQTIKQVKQEEYRRCCAFSAVLEDEKEGCSCKNKKTTDDEAGVTSSSTSSTSSTSSPLSPSTS